MNKTFKATVLVFSLVWGFCNSLAWGQGYGTDTQNVLMPASGGMAGVSVARPQDVPSAIFGNPASLAQFQGTQFCLGAAWVEGYPTITNNGSLNQQNPGQPFSVTSRSQGFAVPAIGVTQDLRARGIPGTLGLGLSGLSGLGAEYRGRVPENDPLNNLSGEYMVLGINVGAGFELTDRLSVGASMTLGSGFEQLGFVGPIVSSAMVNAYALRGSVGADYKLNDCNTLGAYYQSKMDFNYPAAIRVGGNYRDLRIDQPDTFGIGWANNSLMNGDLLLAADVYYKLWENAALYQDVFVNQWAFALGTQLTRGKTKYRLGYSYNSNPLNHNVGASLDGFPIAQDELQLFQAASLATITQHRISGGIGRSNFLVPNLDLDLFAGGLFPASDQFGNNSVSVAVYYIGLGLTWKYGAPCTQSE
jgi:long-chain fatty acid transport protein